MIEDRVRRLGSHIENYVGHVEGVPKGRGEKNLLEGPKWKKVIRDESTHHSNRKISHRTLRQLCKSILCYAKVWLDSEAKRANVRCASKKFVQAHCRGQYPSTQESRSKITIWERRCVKLRINDMLLDVNGGDLKRQMCKMHAAEL